VRWDFADNFMLIAAKIPGSLRPRRRLRNCSAEIVGLLVKVYAISLFVQRLGVWISRHQLSASTPRLGGGQSPEEDPAPAIALECQHRANYPTPILEAKKPALQEYIFRLIASRI
jgi:hypothetical protein